MIDRVEYWIRFSVFNLLLVAAIGVVLRFKIAFEFPYLSQKHLQLGHSHFAFFGWITQALFTLLLHQLNNYSATPIWKKFRWLMFANVGFALILLFAFIFQGYSTLSVTALSLCFGTSFVFSWMYLGELRRSTLPITYKNWVKAGIGFNAFSAFGAFYLAYMFLAKDFEQHKYLAAVYFFLHFQYNGWFYFACMALLASQVHKHIPAYVPDKRVFVLFLSSCLPAYFLSVLWANIPLWLYLLVIAAALLQLLAWFLFIKSLGPFLSKFRAQTNRLGANLILLSALAFTVKLLLQLGSTIPAISKLAFGIRPIVIAYLHLVLLGVITVFILGFSISFGVIKLNKSVALFLGTFVFGILLNEFLLLLQGIGSFVYYFIPYSNQGLFFAALTMMLGLLGLWLILKLSARSG